MAATAVTTRTARDARGATSGRCSDDRGMCARVIPIGEKEGCSSLILILYADVQENICLLILKAAAFIDRAWQETSGSE